MNTLNLGVCVLAVAFLAQGSSLAGRATESEWKDLRADKVALAAEADRLSAMARGYDLSSWESHATRLTAIRHLVNRSAQRIARLESDTRLTAAEREAAKAMREHLSQVAARTEALIGRLNTSRRSVLSPAYYKEVQSLAAAAERSAQAADRALEVALNGRSAGESGD